jgi:DNA-binding MarR family transcriptional regulator
MAGAYHRVLSPDADAHRFTEACFALSSGTRIEVLKVLLHATEPVHIREVARRLQLDPSPVRGHLDLLVKTGFAREIPEPGRERRFVANVSDLRLVLVPPVRPADADPAREESKPMRKLAERMKDVEAKMHKLELELAKLGEERASLWLQPAED